MDANYWVGQGVLGVVLLVLMGGLVKIVLWAKAAVVEPVVKSHLSLVATLQEQSPKQTEALNKQSDTLTRQEAQLAKQTGQLDQQTQILDHQAKALDDLVSLAEEQKCNFKEKHA